MSDFDEYPENVSSADASRSVPLLPSSDRRHPLTPELGATETDEEFYRRREQEELVRAMFAADSNVRDAHYALVDAYRILISELASRRPG